jgi:hypothetical protein
MELRGKVVAVLPTVTYGKEGKKKGVLVIEYGDRYPKKAAITFFERLLPNIDGVKVGDELLVEVSIDSREWQGKWFTDVLANKVQTTQGLEKKEEVFQVPDQHGDLPF